MFRIAFCTVREREEIPRCRSIPTLSAVLFTFLPYVAEELECTEREGEKKRVREGQEGERES